MVKYNLQNKTLLEKSAGHCKLLPKALSAREIINQCRRLSAVSSIEVCHTAISRTDLCTRHSTVQYSTVHRIQYNRFGKQRLLRMTLSLLKLPCASLTPDPVSYTHTHTRPATEPSATRRHVSCHVISGQPRPRLRS